MLLQLHLALCHDTLTYTQYSSLFTPTQAKYGWPSFKKWGFNVNTLYKALFDSVVTTMNSLFCSSRKYIADVVVQTVYCFPVTLTQFAAIQEWCCARSLSGKAFQVSSVNSLITQMSFTRLRRGWNEAYLFSHVILGEGILFNLTGYYLLLITWLF